MKLHKWLFLCGAFPFLAINAFCQTASDLGSDNSRIPQKGVVVEELTKNFEAGKAGVQEGDILLHWSRSGADGEIESPFDVTQVEIEQAPRGTITLEGLRGSEKRTWVMGHGGWRVTTRPILSGDLLSAYLEAQKLAAAGKLEEAAERLRSAATTAKETQSAWLGCWFLFHTGDLWGNVQRWNEAEAAYGKAIEESTDAGPMIRIQLLRAQALTVLQRGEWSNAEKHYQQAVEESQKVSLESLMLADMLDYMAYAVHYRGDLEQTEKYRLQALAIREKLAPESLAFAKSLYLMGNVAADQSDLIKANDYFDRALTVQEKLDPDGIDTARTLTGMGGVAAQRGDLAGAEQSYRRAWAISEKLAPESMLIAASLTNLGGVAQERGDLNKAEEYYRRALTLWEKLAPETTLVAANLNRLGSVAMERGDPDKAEEYYQKALTIEQKQAPNDTGNADVLGNLGLVAQTRGNLKRAEEYLQQALAIQEKIAPGSLNVAESLSKLGNVERNRGDLSKAEEYDQRSLAIAEKDSPGSLYVATSINNLGDLSRDRGDLDKAEQYYRQGQAIWEKLAPERKEYAAALAGEAKILIQKQQWDAAAPLLEKALNVLDNQLSHLGGGEATRTGFRAQHAGYYQDYIDLLMQQKRPETALQVLERSRAQTMLEMLTEAHMDIHQGVNPALLEREHSLQADLSAKVDRRIRLQGGKHADEIAAMNKEMELLLAQYNEVEGEIRTSSPSYAALTQPQSLSSQQIQQQLLDADTVLLEYSLGEEHSYLFAVTPTSLTSFELPRRSEIESVAQQIYRQLTARNRVVKGETEAARKSRLAKAEAEFGEATTLLSRMILLPVAEQLKRKRLLIVSDGALQDIPFALLPEPGSLDANQPGISQDVAPLIVEHEIVNLPSASVLAVLRRERIGRKEAAKAVAVLADPVFSAADARVAAGQKDQRQYGNNHPKEKDEIADSEAWATEHLTRSVADLGLSEEGGYLPRLRSTRQEAEAIMAVTPAGKGMKALDFRASWETATNPELRQYRVVHFATHGLLDSEHPELSGLVLSLVDERGKPKNGFLELEDIYNMNLPAELVVLSACETGLGKEVQGEGLIGLTRGFMYAGASRVVASLWKVDDIATAELMGRFYKAMEKDGLPPAAALRQAQIEMWKQKDWRAPYYWAAFQMQGEWK